MQVLLVRLQGAAEQLRLPVPYDDDEERLELFDRASKLIHAEWLERRRAEGSGRISALPWLTTISYELLTHVLEMGMDDVFTARLQAYSRATRGRAAATPLHTGLLSMFAHDAGTWKSNERGRLGDRLWFAYRQAVLPAGVWVTPPVEHPTCIVHG